MSAYPNLKAEIARKGLSYIDLSILIGMSRVSLSNKMRGKYEFSLSEAMLIKKVLGDDLTLDYLFKRSEG